MGLKPMRDVCTIMQRAFSRGLLIPAFNIPHLPMMEPVIRALRDTDSFGLIMVARLEWMKFGAKSLRAVYSEYQGLRDEKHVRLHLDHIPVIDEDNRRVPYVDILTEAVSTGYDSVMIDGSRLSLEENIEATRQIVRIAHAAGVPVEAELGAVMGHEEGPPLPYEEIFASGKGFTSVEEAARFVKETGVDWLSVAIGNVHGAVAASRRNEKKVAARLDIGHLAAIRKATDVPLVLHGGSGIPKTFIQEGVKNGISKINVGTALRQCYEAASERSVAEGQQAVYDAMLDLIENDFEIRGTAGILAGTSDR